jgi:hypothetical protein
MEYRVRGRSCRLGVVVYQVCSYEHEAFIMASKNASSQLIVDLFEQPSFPLDVATSSRLYVVPSECFTVSSPPPPSTSCTELLSRSEAYRHT